MSLTPVNKLNISGRTLIVRADFNSNIQNSRPVISSRIIEHAKTLKELSRKKTRLIVLSHQGRKGEKDFTSLKEHSKILSRLTGKKVLFSEWNNFIQKVKNLKKGQILLLENTRFLENETKELSPLEHSKEKWIQDLAKEADLFVLDAFSVSHRSHASVVGFLPLLPSCIGGVMEKELNSLSKALSFTQKPRLLILGGIKPKDSIKTIEFFLKQGKADKVLLGGALSEVFLSAQGHKLGAKDSFIRKKNFTEFIPKAKELLNKYGSRILLPIDLAFDENKKRKELSVDDLPSKYFSKDIGERTIKLYSDEIAKARMIVFNGPFGVFEEKEFSLGTKSILKSIASSNAFSFLGGGDTETALLSFKIPKNRFSYVSLSGKASLKFLSGKTLSAIEELKNHKKQFFGLFELKKEKLLPFLKELNKKTELIVPSLDHRKIKRFKPFPEANLYMEKPTTFSTKKYFLPSGEALFEFNEKNSSYSVKPLPRAGNRIFFGIRSCDLHAISILDSVFLKEPIDSFYWEKRENSILIGLSCEEAGENCFCTSLGTHLPQEFDLFFWRNGKNYLAEVGSEKGLKLINKKFFSSTEKHSPLTVPKTPRKINSKNFEEILKKNFSHKEFEKNADICLSCGSCTMVCPTCYCYRIKDDFALLSNDAVRMREWDSCQLKRFTRVSGDHIFRKSRTSRLRHFILHKLLYHKKNFPQHLCVGCGRCIDVCPVSIDIVKIVNNISGEKNEE
ncbi:MAG: phosphoglycerate kinase [archaeon]